MKAIYKTFLLAALFLLCCHSAAAQQQSDTIQGLDVRYYRNCFWLDTTMPVYNVSSNPCNVSAGLNYNQRVAFRFVPDRPLNIIGIAGAMTLAYCDWIDIQGSVDPMAEEMFDSIVAHRQQEYFELYSTRVYDSVGNLLQDVDSLILLGSLQWALTDSSRFMTLPAHNLPVSTKTFPIIERYFSKPILLDTDFYIGFTNFNRGYIPYSFNPQLPLYNLNTNVRYYILRQQQSELDDIETYCLATVINAHDGDSSSNVFFQRPTSDTNLYEPWTWAPVDYPLSPQKNEMLPLLFPIVDTTGMNIIPGKTDSSICYAVEGFRLIDQQGNAAAFAWTQDNVDSWQLSWGEEGIAPEEGTLVDAPTNVKSVVGLQDSVVYTAFVRARCNDTLFSEWSAPLRFWKGMNDTVSLLPHNTVEQLTYLYPNPAENSVTVACSFAMSLVELFALDGTKLISQPANGVMTQIDLATLPKGTYMLRISTSAGTAIKKLIRR